MKKYLQGLFVKYLTKHLFNAITERDLLRIIGRDRDGVWIVMYRGKRMGSDKVERIKESAELFMKSDIWRILSREVKHEANKRMYDKSKSIADIMFGKAMLYDLEVIDKKIRELGGL